MRRITGSGGSLHALGEPFEFQAPLQDCGDGWDWRGPEGLRYWLPEGLSFEVRNGEWSPAGVVEVHHRFGRVAFTRCVSGMEVRAKGVCRPSSLIMEGEDWEIGIDAIVSDTSVLGVEGQTTTARTTGASAIIKGEFSGETEQVLAWLPTSTQGTFVGIGKVVCQPGQVQIRFNPEGVSYGNR